MHPLLRWATGGWEGELAARIGRASRLCTLHYALFCLWSLPPLLPLSLVGPQSCMPERSRVPLLGDTGYKEFLSKMLALHLTPTNSPHRGPLWFGSCKAANVMMSGPTAVRGFTAPQPMALRCCTTGQGYPRAGGRAIYLRPSCRASQPPLRPCSVLISCMWVCGWAPSPQVLAAGHLRLTRSSCFCLGTRGRGQWMVLHGLFCLPAAYGPAAHVRHVAIWPGWRPVPCVWLPGHSWRHLGVSLCGGAWWCYRGWRSPTPPPLCIIWREGAGWRHSGVPPSSKRLCAWPCSWASSAGMHKKAKRNERRACTWVTRCTSGTLSVAAEGFGWGHTCAFYLTACMHAHAYVFHPTACMHGVPGQDTGPANAPRLEAGAAA